jgi:hypothetical protein
MVSSWNVWLAQLFCLRICHVELRVANFSQGAWGYDLFQSDTDLDTLDELNDSADLDKVRQKILADPARYTFPKIEKSEDAKDQKQDADIGIDEDLIYMTLNNPSHPVSQLEPMSATNCLGVSICVCLCSYSADIECLRTWSRHTLTAVSSCV